MRAIPHRMAKMEYLINRQNGRCPIALSKGKEIGDLSDLHHLFHDSKSGNKKFPLAIHSLLNLRAVNHWYHMANPSWGIVGLMRMIQIENFLFRHPAICRWVNKPDKSLLTVLSEYSRSKNIKKAY